MHGKSIANLIKHKNFTIYFASKLLKQNPYFPKSVKIATIKVALKVL